ncbi:MAG: transglycosylase domain-containing protein [Acidimicrobiales bacterium]
MRVIVRFLVAILVAGAGVAGGTLLLAAPVSRLATSGVGGTEGDPLALQPLAARSVVYARDGSVLTTLQEEENRVPVSLDKVPAHVQRAVLDAEDDRFFEHGALDLRALTRAMVVNVQSGGIYEGGSTITQQLIKISLLDSQQKASRKIKEAALAIRLESEMSKNQILERYINAVYLGNHAYGLEAGAETYFDKHVDQLDLGEGILLASLIRDPVGADPFVQPDAALRRRDAVIDRMAALGHVGPEEVAALKAQPLPTPPPAKPVKGSDYFATAVRKQLLDDPRLGETPRQRFDAVFKGGLTIRTTLDPVLQQEAEAAVNDILTDTGGEFGAALVSVEPTTGAVRALVGGSDFPSAQFDLATQGRRQPGSAFKVFTLVAALESGYSPRDTILGTAPCQIPDGSREGWAPDNVEGGASGVLTLTDATVSSVNCAYARLIKLVGPEKVAEVAHRMGIRSELEPPYLSLTLGAREVTPLDMASAYGTLAADGEHHPPVFVDEVLDREGKVILEADPAGTRALSAQDARTVNQTLTQVVQRGTGRAAAIPGWTAAGKTGSSDENKNAWFVGYTPTLSTAVWMGSPAADVPMRNVGGITVFGGTFPARIWQQFMAAALGPGPGVDFPEPEPSGFGSQYLNVPGSQGPASTYGPSPSTRPAPRTVVAEPVPAEPIFEAPPSLEIQPDPRGFVPNFTIPDLPDRPAIRVPRDRPGRPSRE